MCVGLPDVLLRISWTSTRTNASVLEEIKSPQLQYGTFPDTHRFGRITRANNMG